MCVHKVEELGARREVARPGLVYDTAKENEGLGKYRLWVEY